MRLHDFQFMFYATEIEIDIETEFRRFAFLNQNGFVTVTLDSQLLDLTATHLFFSNDGGHHLFGLKKPP